MKVDGHPLAVNLYRKGSAQEKFVQELVAGEVERILKELKEQPSEDKLAKLNLQLAEARFAQISLRASSDSEDVLTQEFSFVVSGRKKFLAPFELQDYFVGAISGGCLGKRVVLRDSPSTQRQTPLDVWASGTALEFGKHLGKFWGKANEKGQTTMMTLSFEAVCAKRVSPWGVLHSELACEYPHDMLRFLGATFFPPRPRRMGNTNGDTNGN